MKKAIFLLCSLVFGFLGLSAQTLELINVGPQLPLASVFFADNLVGYAASTGGAYLKTTNGGANWFVASTGRGEDIHSFYFNDAATGYACGQFGWMGKTTNGGASWISTSLNSPYLWSVCFTDYLTGYTVGESSTVFKTTNAGVSWLPQSIPVNNIVLTDVKFINGKGYVSAANITTNLLTTTDGGANWQNSKVGTGSIASYGADFRFSHGYLVGYDQNSLPGHPSTFVTTNNGGSWDQKLSSSRGILYSVAVSPVNPNIAIAIGGYENDLVNQNRPMIRRTSNGGTTWTEEAWGASGDGLKSVTATATHFIIVGYKSNNDGIVLKTSQTVSVSSLGSEIPTRYELLQNYPNPFNPATKIRFSLPEASEISLSLFDMGGKKVADLAGGNFLAGRYEVSFNAEGLASGMYFYKLSGSNFVKTKKMTLVK